MNKSRLTIATALLFTGLLAGCQSLDDMDREAYQRACDNLDIQRGTPVYDECMLQQQRMDNDNLQRSMDRSTEERLLNKL